LVVGTPYCKGITTSIWHCFYFCFPNQRSDKAAALSDIMSYIERPREYYVYVLAVLSSDSGYGYDDDDSYGDTRTQHMPHSHP